MVDAFSGDAIPVHLLTREAFEIYRKHLAPGGMIAVHVSNRYLRLAPVVRRLAEDCGMRASRIDDKGFNASHLQSSSLWVLVTNNDRFLKANPSDPPDWGDDDFRASLWTDHYSNLFQILSLPGDKRGADGGDCPRNRPAERRIPLCGVCPAEKSDL